MFTRRDFLRTAAITTAGIAAGELSMKAQAANSQSAESIKRVNGAGNKVNLACIGIGNRGEQVIGEWERTGLANIVALCDVDMGGPQTLKVMGKYPKARQFKDYREMFDKMGNEIEAVSVVLPDFSHFPAVMLSMAYGKHVFVEKPMARTFLEAELMMKAARKYKNLVTQVGNQGHSEANYYQFKAWKEAGIIKDVTAITAHMNSSRRWHSFDPKMNRPLDKQPIPSTLDWDLWHGTAPYHEFNEQYHQGNWRCWYDFGMGALGDWGAHILDTAHEFLKLDLPTVIDPLRIDGHTDYFFPMASTILFHFPKRKGMPACDVTWYDGVNNLPPLPKGYGVSELDPNIPAAGGNSLQASSLNPGKIIYSKDLTFKGGTHGSTLSIIPAEKAKEMASKLPEVPKMGSNHYSNFLLACTGAEKTRSPFETFGPLSQVFSLGVMAQRLNTRIEFDPETKTITNNAFANAMLTGIPPRSGWEQYYKI
ncbi:MAG: Gfo/Idh/MocA family oxidoreductase [Bacteroidales bacterium]|nr:Gfo/Idh/MocA family oxidoreductase [Bacteroidales bacterium]